MEKIGLGLEPKIVHGHVYGHAYGALTPKIRDVSQAESIPRLTVRIVEVVEARELALE